MLNHRAARAIAAVVATGALAGIGSAVAGASTDPAPDHTRSTEAVPTTLTGHTVTSSPQTEKPGTVLTGKYIGFPRVFSTSASGLAIGSDRQGNAYAAITTNGGTTWTIASPALFTATADAPNAVSSVATAGTSIDIVYGPQSIDVTGNGGRSWSRVYPDGFVTSVVKGLRGIAAYVQITGANDKILATDEYVSTNAGRSWRLENILGG